jgi:hypothetical protein
VSTDFQPIEDLPTGTPIVDSTSLLGRQSDGTVEMIPYSAVVGNTGATGATGATGPEGVFPEGFTGLWQLTDGADAATSGIATSDASYIKMSNNTQGPAGHTGFDMTAEFAAVRIGMTVTIPTTGWSMLINYIVDFGTHYGFAGTTNGVTFPTDGHRTIMISFNGYPGTQGLTGATGAAGADGAAGAAGSAVALAPGFTHSWQVQTYVFPFSGDAKAAKSGAASWYFSKNAYPGLLFPVGGDMETVAAGMTMSVIGSDYILNIHNVQNQSSYINLSGTATGTAPAVGTTNLFMFAHSLGQTGPTGATGAAGADGADGASGDSGPVDDSSLSVISASNLQGLADSVDHALLKARGTGVASTYVASAAAGGTTFDVPAVHGEIYSDIGFFHVTYAGATGITVANLNASSTYVYLDSSSVLQQQTTTPTREDWSRKLFLMRIGVNPATNLILGFEYLNNPLGNDANSLRDIYTFLVDAGVPFKSGQTITGRSADLGFDAAAGTLLEFGGTGDVHNANIKSFDAVSGATWKLMNRTGVESDSETELPLEWDNATTVTALGSTTWVAHRLFRFSSGNFALQRGQGNYANLVLARAGSLLEDYVLNPQLKDGTFFGWWFVSSTATNTNQTSLVEFREYTMGVQGGSSSGLSGALLKGSNLSDVSDAGTALANIGGASSADSVSYTTSQRVTLSMSSQTISGPTDFGGTITLAAAPVARLVIVAFSTLPSGSATYDLYLHYSNGSKVIRGIGSYISKGSTLHEILPANTAGTYKVAVNKPSSSSITFGVGGGAAFNWLDVSAVNIG